MKWVSSLSTSTFPKEAIREAIAGINTQLNGAKPDAAFLFTSGHFRSYYGEIGAMMNGDLSPRHWAGCSAGGIIGKGKEVEDAPAISITAGILPNVEITSIYIEDGRLPDSDSSPRKWEDVIGVKASSEPNFVLLADPFSVHVDDLLAGLDYAYPKAIKVGGLASGGQGPRQNGIFLDQKVYRQGAAMLAFSGNLSIDTLVAQGCRPIGKPMQITRCMRNILIELDRRRALESLTEVFENATEVDRRLIRTSLFLGLVMDPFKHGEPAPGDFLIRNLVGMDPEKGVLAIGAMLREGQTVQFHVRDAEAASADLIAVLRRYSTENLNSTAGEALPSPPRGALLFSCLGRGLHLYGAPDHDTKAFISELGDLPLGGFFCNGEIGPVSGTTHTHGFTSCFGIFRAKD